MTLQPDPDPQHRTLVEHEGVNAGSDRSTVESDRDGFSPHVAPGGEGPSVPGPADQGPDDEAGAALAPAADAVESGQDNGAMS